MLSLMFCTLMFLFAAQEETPEAPKPEPSQAQLELAALSQSLGSAESYAFRIESKEEGTFGRGRQGRDQEPQAAVVTGKYVKDQPVHLKLGAVEAYRAGVTTVYREGEAAWQLFDRERMMRGFGGRGPGGERGEEGEAGREPPSGDEEEGGEPPSGDRPPRGEGEEGGGEPPRGEGEPGRDRAARGEEGGFGAMRTLVSVNRAVLPHEALKQALDKVEKVESAETDGNTVYTATLTPAGAEALAGAGRFGRGRGGEEGGPSFDFSGTLRLTAGPEGAVEKIEIRTTMKGSFNEREFEQIRTSMITVSDLGKVEIEVPEEVKALLEA